MFANLSIHTAALGQMVFYERPCKYVSRDELQDQWAKKAINMRSLKNPASPQAMAAHRAAQTAFLQHAHAAAPVQFLLESKGHTMLEDDKKFHAARDNETSLQHL
jgi:hypothetical protein